MLFLRLSKNLFINLEKGKDLSKLIKKQIVDKNGNIKTVYVRMDNFETTRQKIKKFKKIFMEEPKEHGMAISSEGKILNYKIGNESRIIYTKRELRAIRGAKLYIHNHPKGASFSSSDIKFAIENEISEIECFGIDKKNDNTAYNFSLKINKDAKIDKDKLEKIIQDYSFFYQQLFMERQLKLSKKQIDGKGFSRLFISEVVERLSEKHKDIFTYEKHKII